MADDAATAGEEQGGGVPTCQDLLRGILDHRDALLQQGARDGVDVPQSAVLLDIFDRDVVRRLARRLPGLWEKHRIEDDGGMLRDDILSEWVAGIKLKSFKYRGQIEIDGREGVAWSWWTKAAYGGHTLANPSVYIIQRQWDPQTKQVVHTSQEGQLTLPLAQLDPDLLAMRGERLFTGGGSITLTTVQIRVVMHRTWCVVVDFADLVTYIDYCHAYGVEPRLHADGVPTSSLPVQQQRAPPLLQQGGGLSRVVDLRHPTGIPKRAPQEVVEDAAGAAAAPQQRAFSTPRKRPLRAIVDGGWFEEEVEGDEEGGGDATMADRHPSSIVRGHGNPRAAVAGGDAAMTHHVRCGPGMSDNGSVSRRAARGPGGPPRLRGPEHQSQHQHQRVVRSNADLGDVYCAVADVNTDAVVDGGAGGGRRGGKGGKGGAARGKKTADAAPSPWELREYELADVRGEAQLAQGDNIAEDVTLIESHYEDTDLTPADDDVEDVMINVGLHQIAAGVVTYEAPDGTGKVTMPLPASARRVEGEDKVQFPHRTPRYRVCQTFGPRPSPMVSTEATRFWAEVSAVYTSQPPSRRNLPYAPPPNIGEWRLKDICLRMRRSNGENSHPDVLETEFAQGTFVFHPPRSVTGPGREG